MKNFILIAAMLAMMPVAEVLANSEKARIVTRNSLPADCLSPVAVNKIDGERKLVSPVAFDLEPGVHSINGVAKVDTTFCTISPAGNFGGRAPDLEMEFEAGKTYYIGYEHKSKNREDWKLVVWKVE